MADVNNLTTEVANLVTATTDLTNEVAGQKDRLVATADQADQSAVSASEDQALAKAYRDEATSQASIAESEADRASQIAGLDTVNEAVEMSLTSSGLIEIPRNKRMYDNQSNPNDMYHIPPFNCEDMNARILELYGVDLQLGTGIFPAFLYSGTPIKRLWAGKYTASAGENGGCSVIQGTQPRVSVNYDTAKALCENKGSGWFLSSGWVWAALALHSLANETIPRGNTNYGRHHDKKFETCKRSDTMSPGDTAGTPRSDCGTGPDTWSHNHAPSGVFDLVGNVWEWIDGFKLQDGQFIVNPDNDFTFHDSLWLAQDAYLDAVSDVTLSHEVTVRDGIVGDDANSGTTRQKNIADITKSAEYQSNLLLRQLFVEFAAKPEELGRLYMRNYGERLPFRGGDWYHGSNAGLGALNLHISRSTSSSSVGFRPAFLEL